jgi:hypothetical protein
VCSRVTEAADDPLQWRRLRIAAVLALNLDEVLAVVCQ